MQESAMNLGAFGFWIFLAVVVAGAMWEKMRKLQIRKDLIQSMLEKGQSVDVEQINKLLGPSHNVTINFDDSRKDPRSAIRAASFCFFIAGFSTLFVAFIQEPPMYLLALLGAYPLYLAYAVWQQGDREYEAGTLPTLKYPRDPREPWQHGGGWFFWIGYATIFVSLYKYNLNMPLLALGVIAIIIAYYIWDAGNREYAEGKIPVNGPDPDDKKE